MEAADQQALIREDDELANANATGSGPGRISLEACDSPIEDQFLWAFMKVASPRVIVTRQVELETTLGKFRPDFLISRPEGGKKIVVECDGREFHEGPRDSRRDAAIVKSGAADRVYRLKGKDICWKIHELLELLGNCEPWILSERGRVNLATLTAPESNREEYLDADGAFFTGSAFRFYRPPEQEDSTEDDEDDDDGDPYPHRPIGIDWTA